ncbi:uncharacterized protein OCT59_024966 [Rhizophagus irregularis]|uniref:Rox1p n=2 Tax=Rhizophagus irregularis TaxID=588596 RepID=A0A015J9P8_RHIIW|nr:Rox1p [Rhizophagus irregularis DAOM 197198w]UZO04589.1 hypothetical protein OCT59_024966 [Rhizophagus irregularis]GBC12144.1 mating type protein MAT1-1-3 [Rhizophagus irregularis DAOM 181602=DAOM 197198]CAG8613706.1 14323_t:CDS:1 [Rhizophagus irregularis]
MTIEEFIKLETQILTLDVEYLINNSNKTRNARRNAKKGIKRAPRPQNSFVIYRRNKNAELFNVKREERKRLPEFSEISKDIADSWSKESDDVKKFFKIMARMAERLHSIKYPYYKYQPGPIKTKQKKQKNNPSEETVDHVNINQPANLVDNLFFNDDLPSLMDQSYNYYGNLQESESEWDFNQFLNRDDCESQNY